MSSRNGSRTEPNENEHIHLLQKVNALLVYLQLPITLESLFELTPSLLLAVLECLLETRVPIEHETRRLLALASTSKKPTRDIDKATLAKIHAMKLFLGTLETDIVKADVGLSAVDPEKLAEGGWDEVVIVARVLGTLFEGLHELFDEEGPSISPKTATTTTARHLHQDWHAEDPNHLHLLSFAHTSLHLALLRLHRRVLEPFPNPASASAPYASTRSLHPLPSTPPRSRPHPHARSQEVNNSPTKSPFTPRLATHTQTQGEGGTCHQHQLWIKKVDLEEEVRRFSKRERSERSEGFEKSERSGSLSGHGHDHSGEEVDGEGEGEEGRNRRGSKSRSRSRARGVKNPILPLSFSLSSSSSSSKRKRVIHNHTDADDVFMDCDCDFSPSHHHHHHHHHRNGADFKPDFNPDSSFNLNLDHCASTDADAYNSGEGEGEDNDNDNVIGEVEDEEAEAEDGAEEGEEGWKDPEWEAEENHADPYAELDPHQQTILLLQERARLLEELARFRVRSVKG
ncbi:hypothetical protein D9758_016371 [Tetrapyrgos nigripes]|uniref:Uncharacterized protein n=1 Tax=Tetrapyrgos nigripes TaxID=182062 RepID=A0A8H5CD31_9AGAR|nr:hypothetical protein D9758_016371 [Tetrapyrgos nigripes]